MAESVDQLKQEISEQYIKDFKKELWWLKSLALLPIENKVKKILVWEIDLPDKFDEVKEFWWWKDIINFVSPKTASKILEFMKEKRLEIEKRRTEEELQDLKNEILWLPTQNEEHETPSQWWDQQDDHQQWGEHQESQDQQSEHEWDNENDSNSSVAWAVASWAWFWATMAMWKLAESENYRKLAEWLDAKQIRSTIESWIVSLEKYKNVLGGTRLSSRQVNTIDKHLNKLRDWLDSIWDDSIELLKARWELDNKLPKEVLEGSWISQSQILKIEKYSDKMSEIIEAAKKEGVSEWEIAKRLKKLLNENNVVWVSDDVLKSLAKAKDASEIKKMLKIIRHGSRLNKCIQTLKWALLVDVACLGLDVWVYLETKKEADLIKKVNEVRANNKKNQAYMQLWIWIWSVLAEAWVIVYCVAAWTSTWGPFWAVIWLAIWALTTAASIWVDSLYYDVKDFYLQNKEDFIREKKSKINQAILQWIYNKKNWNVSLNEMIWAPDKETKEQSLRDACWSMIFLDEIQDGNFSYYTPFLEYATSGKKKEDYVATLTEEQKKQFEEERVKLESQISLRMEYVEKNFEWGQIINALKAWKWMNSLNTLFTESRIYAEMKSEGKWNERTAFDINLRRYKSEYFSEFSSEKLEKLEKLKQDYPLLFQELMVTASLSSLLGEDEENSNYTENVKLVKKYQDWLKLTQTDKEKIAMEIPDSHKNVNFIEKFLEADFDITKVQFGSMDEERLKWLIGLNEERYWEIETSDNPFQNTLYRLAKELFGYTGKNTKEWVMEFYSEADWNVHGIYYKDAWIINNDWAKDSDVKWAVWKWKVFDSQAEVDAYINKFMSENMTGDSIDTATESVDNYLQKEFETKFRAILKEELSPRTKQNQEKIKKDITNFVKAQSKNGEYIELPYYILIQARKAGLWDLQRQFFRRNNWKLEVCLLPSELSTNTLDAKATYLSPAREEFTEEEKVYVERVERAHADVENLRDLWWTWFLTDTFTDELDLPKEIEIMISDKYKEWEKFKSDVMMYSPDSVVRIWIYERYKEFAEYFENLYRGILLALTTYSMSNDVDTYALFSQALALWNWDYFDEKWALKEDASIDFLKEPKLKAFYNEQISKQKIDWKTIQELWNSEKSEERDLALQASKEILTAILEQSMLVKDENWKITKINIWGNWFDSDTNDWFDDNKAETEKQIVKRLSNLKVLPVFDKEKIQKLMKPQKIKPLTEKESKIVQAVPELQKKIEETKSEVVWQWKRGNIEYNPEKSTIKSRWQEVKIEEKNGKYYIKWFNYGFTNLKEMLWVANFRNWARAKFRGKTIAYDRDLFNSSGSRRYTLVVKESWPKSDTMLIARWDLEGYFPACKSDSVLKSLAEWINREVK